MSKIKEMYDRVSTSGLFSFFVIVIFFLATMGVVGQLMVDGYYFWGVVQLLLLVICLPTLIKAIKVFL